MIAGFWIRLLFDDYLKDLHDDVFVDGGAQFFFGGGLAGIFIYYFCGSIKKMEGGWKNGFGGRVGKGKGG